MSIIEFFNNPFSALFIFSTMAPCIYMYVLFCISTFKQFKSDKK
jgi:hypothetical protein